MKRKRDDGGFDFYYPRAWNFQKFHLILQKKYAYGNDTKRNLGSDYRRG
jgi:hypothetical protein